MPTSDALGVVSWMIRGLGALALEVDADRNLEEPKRRAELIRIAVSMARLRPQAQIDAVRREIAAFDADVANDKGPGPQLVDAAPDFPPARRGKPPRTALR
jgi:hypothetical protein